MFGPIGNVLERGQLLGLSQMLLVGSSKLENTIRINLSVANKCVNFETEPMDVSPPSLPPHPLLISFRETKESFGKRTGPKSAPAMWGQSLNFL